MTRAIAWQLRARWSLLFGALPRPRERSWPWTLWVLALATLGLAFFAALTLGVERTLADPWSARAVLARLAAAAAQNWAIASLIEGTTSGRTSADELLPRPRLAGVLGNELMLLTLWVPQLAAASLAVGDPTALRALWMPAGVGALQAVLTMLTPPRLAGAWPRALALAPCVAFGLAAVVVEGVQRRPGVLVMLALLSLLTAGATAALRTLGQAAEPYRPCASAARTLRADFRVGLAGATVVSLVVLALGVAANLAGWELGNLDIALLALLMASGVGALGLAHLSGIDPPAGAASAEPLATLPIARHVWMRHCLAHALLWGLGTAAGIGAIAGVAGALGLEGLSARAALWLELVAVLIPGAAGLACLTQVSRRHVTTSLVAWTLLTALVAVSWQAPGWRALLVGEGLVSMALLLWALPHLRAPRARNTEVAVTAASS